MRCFLCKPSHLVPYQSGKGGAGGLSELLGGLDLGAEGTEDSLMQVMEGVMSTLLSKDVLYPSLSDLCSQVTHTTSSLPPLCMHVCVH